MNLKTSTTNQCVFNSSTYTCYSPTTRSYLWTSGCSTRRPILYPSRARTHCTARNRSCQYLSKLLSRRTTEYRRRSHKYYNLQMFRFVRTAVDRLFNNLYGSAVADITELEIDYRRHLLVVSARSISTSWAVIVVDRIASSRPCLWVNGEIYWHEQKVFRMASLAKSRRGDSVLWGPTMTCQCHRVPVLKTG